MGDMADDAVDAALNEMYWFEDNEYEALYEMAEEGLWETKDGRILKIKHMSDSHLRDVIALLEQNSHNSVWAEVYIDKMKKQLQENLANDFMQR